MMTAGGQKEKKVSGGKKIKEEGEEDGEGEGSSAGVSQEAGGAAIITEK